MSGREALWQQASSHCVYDYGIETSYSQNHMADCEYGGVWDCEECWNSEVIRSSEEGKAEMTEKQRNMIEGMNMLVKRFSVCPDGQQVTVAEIIKASNEVYLEIAGGEEG